MTANSLTTCDYSTPGLYQAVTTPRMGIVQRNASGSVGSLSMLSSSGELKRYGSIGSELPNVRGAVEGREKNKKEMQELNEKLAGHMEKSRYLQAQNKKLKDELTGLKNRWGKETEKIRQMYDVELKQLRRLLDEAEREKGEKQARLASQDQSLSDQRAQLTELTEHLEGLNDKNERLTQELGERDSELAVLRRRVQGLEEDRLRDKRNMNKLKNDLSRLHSELDSETAKRLAAQSEGQTLREELEFCKRVHEQEMKELQALVRTEQDHERAREFWKNELGQALHEIQSEYDERLDVVRAELERAYMNKLLDATKNGPHGSSEINYLRDENKKLKMALGDVRGRLSDLQAKCDRLETDTIELSRAAEEERRRFAEDRDSTSRELQAKESDLQRLLAELQHLMDAKLNLESEIAAYRKLLDADSDKRGNYSTGISQVDHSPAKLKSNSMPPSSDMNDSTGNVQVETKQRGSQIRAELTSKTQYDRSYKGSISIDECATDGKFVQLQNVGTKVEQLSQWRIVRNIDNGRSIIRFTISDLTFAPGQIIKIWARGSRPEKASPADIEMSHTSWGIGNVITTSLYNVEGEERAFHLQKTVYGSSS